MKCANCNKEFNSFEWYKNGLELWKTSDLILCDSCLIEVLEVKKEIMKQDIKLTESKINKLKNKQ